MKKYPLISVAYSDSVKAEALKETARMLDSGILTNFGEYCDRVEAGFSEFIGCSAVGVSNATIGLMIAYEAVGFKGEVLVPSFTFSSTASALLRNDVTPVFYDIDPETLTADVFDMESRITPRTGGIVATHVFGNPCNVEAIEKLGKKHGLPVVFDAAQATGAKISGKMIGNFGTCEVFSCNTTKLLSMGEGGFVCCADNEALEKKLRSLRYFGMSENYQCEGYGTNGKLQEFNAIMGVALLPSLSEKIEMLNILSARYRENLADIPGLTFQKVADDNYSACSLFAVRVNPDQCAIDSASLEQILKKQNIDCRKYFRPLHTTHAYSKFCNGTLPNTENAYRNILCLPLYDTLRLEDIDYIASLVKKTVAGELK